MSVFTFKEFSVQQSNAAMKVSTDGILLGAWADLSECKSLLDIGSGTGLLALMCKQRQPYLTIDAVELDKAACLDANLNFTNCPWPNITLHCCAIQSFMTECTYDMVISNPPYFNNDLKADKHSRTRARHTLSLSHSQLLETFMRLSHNTSKLALILPTKEALEFKAMAEGKGLQLLRICEVKTLPNKPITRCLMLFRKKSEHLVPVHHELLCIKNEFNDYTPAYTQLCKGFYLKM